MVLERIQKKVWQQEHTTSTTLPSLADSKPSDSVVLFYQYLQDHRITPPQKIVDIGCGKGRNSLYLAEHGFEVYALDYISEAIVHAHKSAMIKNVADKIHFSVTDIDARWNFNDNYFDLAIDCFSSIDIETEAGRITYKQEMFRTLKKGGLALITVVAAHDEWEQKLMLQNPGKEKNSSIWPQNGKFQKNYTKEELLEFYAEFEIVELRELQKKAHKLGKDFTATNFWMVLRKN